MAQEQSPQGRVAAVGRVIRGQLGRLAGELRGLDAGGWDAPSACTGWAVKDVAAHMAESNDRFYQVISAALRGESGPEFTAPQRAERQAAVRAGSTDAIVDQLVGRGAACFDMLEGATVEDLARMVTVPAGQLSLEQVAPQRLSECTLHSWDIRVARDAGATLDADAVPLLLDGAIAGAGRLGSRGAPNARDATYAVDVTGPGGGPVGVVVGQGAVRASRGAPARADATLRLPGESFVRLLWGRLDLRRAVQSGTVAVEGDRELAYALEGVFRGV
jgi:uncharacterized protein (TIGR03083 family)